MDCSPPDSSLRGILQAGILEGVVISFSKSRTRLINEASTTTVLSTLHVSLTSQETSPHFIEKQVENRRGMPCPGSHSWWAEGWKTQPGDLSAEPGLLAVCLADKTSQAAPRVPPWGRRQGTRGARGGSRRSSVGLLGQREAPDNSDDRIQRRRGLTPPHRHPRPAGCWGRGGGPRKGWEVGSRAL